MPCRMLGTSLGVNPTLVSSELQGFTTHKSCGIAENGRIGSFALDQTPSTSLL